MGVNPYREGIGSGEWFNLNNEFNIGVTRQVLIVDDAKIEDVEKTSQKGVEYIFKSLVFSARIDGVEKNLRVTGKNLREQFLKLYDVYTSLKGMNFDIIRRGSQMNPEWSVTPSPNQLPVQQTAPQQQNFQVQRPQQQPIPPEIPATNPMSVQPSQVFKDDPNYKHCWHGNCNGAPVRNEDYLEHLKTVHGIQ